jgi:hypothetical protein|tara:strand:- start:331 stop:5685 length:5355 start_codon:yes stop_codon:yes gene_type:complete
MTALLKIFKHLPKAEQPSRFGFNNNDILKYIKLSNKNIDQETIATKLNKSRSAVSSMEKTLRLRRVAVNRAINSGKIKYTNNKIFTENYSPYDQVKARRALLQNSVNKAAKKFNPDKPETWRGIMDIDQSKGKISFILPDNKEVNNFIKLNFKKIRSTRYKGFGNKQRSYEESQDYFLKQVGIRPDRSGLKGAIDDLKKKWKSISDYESALKGKKSFAAKVRTDLENLFFKDNKEFVVFPISKHRPKAVQEKGLISAREYYGRLDDRKRAFNKAMGFADDDPNALEFEHIDSIMDVYKRSGNITSPEVAEKAMNIRNIQFVRKQANRDKSVLFEGNTKDSFKTMAEEARQLEATGQSEKLNLLNAKIQKKVDEFVEARRLDAEDGYPMFYDFTKNDWLPEAAQIKSNYLKNPIRGDDQFRNLIKSKNLTPFFKQGGRVGMDEGGMTFDEMIKDNMENHGMELKDAIEFTVKELYGDKAVYGQGGRVGMNEGGRVKLAAGGLSDKRKRSLESLTKNKVGTLESMLAGVGSGLIDIPKGAFTLGAALLDLGFGTSNAAKVEQYFDDLTGLDEKAEATFMGNLTKIMVNLGVPGGIAAKKGAELTTKALLAKKNGNYFKLTDPRLQKKFKTSLNAKGRLFATLGAAGAAGVADAIFVGDPEHVGTIGDLFGGPTQLLENDENSAAREVINRLKFGVDTSLLMGVVGGSGSAIKSMVRRRNELESNNDAIDKFLGAFRPRGMTPQEFFDLQRKNIGARAGDINYASQVSRSLDKHIDKIFPYTKNIFNKEGNKGRREFMAKLNDTLLSGGVSFDDATKQVRFGEMNAKKVEEITSMMKAKGGSSEDIQGVLDAFGDIRGGWGHMFTRLGGTMDDAAFGEFSTLFGEKFKSYLGATYDVFRNKSLIPLFNYRPSEEAIEKTVKVFREAAEAKGTPITREEAEYYVDQVVKSARAPASIATREDKTAGVYFNVPDFFVNSSTIADIEKVGVGSKTVPLDAIEDSIKPVFDEVLGKIEDPMQTILTGTNKLSLVSRRNEFFQTLKNENASIAAARKAFLEDPENAGKVLPPELRGFFRETELEAMNELGKNVRQIKIDDTRSIEAGITNPLHDLYAEKGVADAIEEAGMLARDNGTLKQLYDNFILYPKATSQMAKTILSPITHARNFISAGAFATANGLIPGLTVSVDDSATAFKEAFGMLQTNIPGTRQANDRYRELLRLGVVNSGVKLGDLQKLLNDVNFGESFTGTQQLRDQMRKLSKLKKWTEDMYTAEDDFWKISSFAMERGRLKKVYDKYGMKYTDDLLDNEAAEIVRNNIPNYDMVSSFVKSLRQLPFGNFVSFPAEIYRTSFNIMGRIMKEFNTPHVLDDGRTVYPFRSIAMKRALGFGTTVVGVPYATVEGMKALYNVTEDEMQALRRFVPEWSKNSTLVPVRGDDGKLKYIDFSHANAYDAMIRPWTTMFNGLQKGIAEDDIKKELLISMIDATKETASPFVSESIWTSAIADISPILGRNGRTQSGRRLWTDETPMGDKFMESIKHLGATVVPGSLPAVIRMKQAVTEEVDEYGRTYEFLDEALGIAGFRAVQVDPVAAMKFKIADFRTGLNDARREFTGPLLKGGPVTSEQIVDQYLVANQAMHRVQKRMFDDYYAARTLGASTEKLNRTFADRVSNTQLRAIRAGQFKPFVPSENIEQAFRDNARAIGEPDNYRRARDFIRNLVRRFNRVSLLGDLPIIENPYRTSLGTKVSEPFSGLPTQPLQDLGLTSPTIGTNLNQTAVRGQQVFGSTDPIFGS